MNNIGLEARLSGPAVRGVTTREKYLDYLDEMKEGSLDFYATMRSLYRQKRRKDISGELEGKDLTLSMLPVDEVYEEIDSTKNETVNITTPIDNVALDEKNLIQDITTEFFHRRIILHLMNQELI